MTNIPDKVISEVSMIACLRGIDISDGDIGILLMTAAPYIAAQALRDEADRVDAMEKSTAPERVRMHMRSVSLRLRADQIAKP